MPAIFLVSSPPDAVLGIIFPSLGSILPGLSSCSTIIRMNGVQPPKAEAFIQTEPGKLDPLRATPSPEAIVPGLKYQLGDARGQQTKPLLVFAEALAGVILFSTVTRYFHETGTVF